MNKRTSVPTTVPPKGFAPWYDGVFEQAMNVLDFEYVEVWRRGDMDTRLIDPRKMHPLMNCYGLWWRPVKAFGEVEQ
jgi:hypothetical protein